jgi:aminopeptidase N
VKKYKFNRSDFHRLPVALEHMDIHLNFRSDGIVEGSNVLHLRTRETIQELRLDARDIEIRSVQWVNDSGMSPARFEHQRDRSLLVVHLPAPVPPGQTLRLRCAATCTPTDHILEGIYRDTTPPGCPQQYMSQCQQWGFQRILPVFDDCTAKCTLVTTLEADARYTHLISNGNISRTHNPAGRPVPKPGDPSRQVITFENSVPMAPYLFLVCVGTWDVLEDEVVYPSGRRIKLEYLVPPGQRAGAVVPMRILKDSVLWQGRTQEYEYPFDVYRTICMEKSNFGGMENVGNTTIITSAALVDEYINDVRLQYAHGVIVHEFEHNQCGSDVTMETPFDMWLNEAFTVDVERQYLMTQFDPDGVRLEEVDSIRAPISGPLAVEDGGHLGNIVREGFNDPDELVDGLTYVKAAEVIRMLRLLLGAETFRRGKNLYFSRHKGGNANTDQFFTCFEEVSGRDLTQFKREWLFTIGYPRVEVEHRYDPVARSLLVSARQTRTGQGGPFCIPIEMAAVNANGRDIPATVRTVEIHGDGAELAFDNVPEPAFLSFNRNYSFYGTFVDRSVTFEQLVRQVRLDPNLFNRVEAMRRITDRERVQLLKDPRAPIGEEWLSLYGEIVANPALPPGLKAYLLRVDELSLDRVWLPFLRERYQARKRLLHAAATRHRDALVEAFTRTDTYAPARDPKDGFDARALKAVLLRTLIEAGTPEIHALAEAHLEQAWNLTDKQSALSCINLSDHPRRSDLLARWYERWKGHLNAYTGYLSIVASGTHDDVFEAIAHEEKRPGFRIEHPSHSRALYLPMAANNKQLWTDRGLRWLTDTVIRLSTINENSTIRLLACCQLVDKMPADLKPKVLAALREIRAKVNESSAPSVTGRLKAYLQEP